MNIKRFGALLAIACLTLLGSSATAEIGTIDAVPAATLLLPYFEVDPASSTGVNTIFSINNASAAATIAHVVIWSDLTVPLLDFNVYLTGYDVESVNLYNLIVNGNLPRTADAGRDTGTDSISPQGAAGLANVDDGTAGIGNGLQNPEDIVIATCAGSLPLSTIPGLLQDRLLDGLSGGPTEFDGGRCVGTNQGDGILRGYITIDNADECSLEFPGDPNYFNGVVVSNENQLWGDYFIIDQAEDFAFGETLVHIEASDELNTGVPNTSYTYYGRYVGFDGSDAREALGNESANRYLQGGGFDGGTDLIVWRDSGDTITLDEDGAGGFVCGDSTPYDIFPLNEDLVVAFNEQEDWEVLCTGTQTPVSPPIPGDPPCFPWETQRVPFEDLDGSFNFGWLYLDLSVPGNDALYDEQAWVVVQMSALGRFSVGYDAIQLNNLTGFLQPPPTSTL